MDPRVKPKGDSGGVARAVRRTAHSAARAAMRRWKVASSGTAAISSSSFLRTAVAKASRLSAVTTKAAGPPMIDRNSVVAGTSVAVRFELGGRRTIEKKEDEAGKT